MLPCGGRGTAEPGTVYNKLVKPNTFFKVGDENFSWSVISIAPLLGKALSVFRNVQASEDVLKLAADGKTIRPISS